MLFTDQLVHRNLCTLKRRKKHKKTVKSLITLYTKKHQKTVKSLITLCVYYSVISVSGSSNTGESYAEVSARPPRKLGRNQYTADRHKKKRAAVTGTGYFRLQAVPANRDSDRKPIFVTRLKPDTSPALLREHLYEETGETLQCKQLKTKHPSYASFVVFPTNKLVEQRLFVPSIWPKGALVRPFVT